MSYQVLARKWRPKTFADLVGQEHVVKALQNALTNGRLHHAYLLTGTRGVGKTTIARILAKNLNCNDPQNGEPCGTCANCQAIDTGRFVDLLEIDAASNTGIENIREVLENAQYAPTMGKYKIYIIDEVHMLSKSAFNAMLKTLEEPPEHVKFILATTDPQKVPITVLSRCLQFVLRNMQPQQVSQHLQHILQQENIEFEPEALPLLGRAAAGSMRDALSLLDQAIALGAGRVHTDDVRQMMGAIDQDYLFELLNLIAHHQAEAVMQLAHQLSQNAISFDGVLGELALLLQQLALAKIAPNAVDPSNRTRLLSLAQQLGDEQIQLYYQCTIHGKNDLPLAPDEFSGFLMALLRMLAFAPIVAPHTPIHAEIQGTVLHETPDTPTPPSEKKTVVKEETVPSEQTSPLEDPFNPFTITEETPSHDDEDFPPAPPPAEIPLTPAEDSHNCAPVHHQDSPSLPQQTESLPLLQADDWFTIAKHIWQQLGSEKMLFQHMAWHDFNTPYLTLAVDREHIPEINPQHLQEIQKILRQCYNFSEIQLQTQDWQATSGHETWQQHQNRLKGEETQRLQQILEQQSSVQDLMQLFQAKWQTDTISKTEHVTDR